MGTVPDAKMTVTVQMVPQTEPVDSLGMKESCTNKDSKLYLAGASAPVQQPSNVCMKTNAGGVSRSPDSMQPDTSGTLNASASSAGEVKKSNITSSTEDHKKSTPCSSAGDHMGSTLTSCARDSVKTTASSSSREQEKSTFTSSSGDHKNSTITSPTVGQDKSRVLCGKDVEICKDMIGEYVSDVTQSHQEYSAKVKVLPTAKEDKVCKTNQSVCMPPSAKTALQTNDTTDKAQSSTVVSVQLRMENTSRSITEDSQTCYHKEDQIQKPAQASCSKHTGLVALAAKQEKAEDVKNSSMDTSLSVQSKDCKDTAGLPCSSASSPAKTENHLLTSKKVTSTSVSAPLQQEKHEKPVLSEVRQSKTMSICDMESAPAHKGEPNTVRKEAGDSKNSSHQHLSTQSHSAPPDGPQRYVGVVPTIGGLSQTQGETQEIKQGNGLLYKEAATMTTGAEQHPPPKHSCHDAEVQAVASVCSQSVGTSPGLLARGAMHEPNGMAMEGAETLAITCQRSSGCAPLFQITMGEAQFCQSSVVMGDACSQTVLSSHVHMGHSHLTSKQVCDHLPEQGRFTSGLCNSQTTGTMYHSDAVVQHDGVGPGAKPKEPLCTVQMGLQPVYQINIEPCSHSNATSNISLCDKESLATDSKYQCKSGPDSKSLAPQSVGGISPGIVVTKDSCQVTADTVAFPTRSSKTPAAGSSSSQLDSTVPAAPPCMTVTKSVKGDERAGPTPLTAAQENKQAAVGKNEDSKEEVSQKHARSSKSDQNEDRAVCSRSKAGPESLKADKEDKKNPTGGGEKASKHSKAKSVHDVVWDEQGMTWEVYGASADPESLGFAIQNHLQSKIREQERKIISKAELRTSVSRGSPAGKRSKRRQKNMFRSLLHNMRRPNCCVRPRPSSVLE